MTRSKSPSGIPGDDVLEYYRKRAAGGVGLIITEGINISDPASQGYPDVPVMYGDALKSWEKIVKAVHKEGGKIAPQLWHVGGLRSPKFDVKNNIPSVGPSGIYYLDKAANHQVKTLSTEQIDFIINSFAEAALNAKEVGFDAIEIHGAHGYLIDQFFWEKTNQRSDKYGGVTLEQRTLFAQEVVLAIREKVGPDFPIIFRFSNWKLGVYENCLFHSPGDLKDFLEPIKKAGVDIFHASSRNYKNPEFEGSSLNLAGHTKKITNLPCISVGSVGLEKDFMTTFTEETQQVSLETLWDKLDEEEFDLIAVGRALISDPDWVNKVQNNKLEDIIPFNKSHIAKL